MQWDSLIPIQGAHSLVWVNGNGQTYATYLSAGVNATCGRLRVLHKRIDTASSDVTPITTWGLYAQMQTSVSFGNSAYVLTFFPSASSTQFVLSKESLSTALTDTTGLVTGFWPTGMNQPYVYAAQLNWQTDPISGSILLIGSVDGPIADPATYDWSTLQAVVTYTDGSSPYHTGVNAGWYGVNIGTTRKDYYDLVDIFTN